MSPLEQLLKTRTKGEWSVTFPEDKLVQPEMVMLRTSRVMLRKYAGDSQYCYITVTGTDGENCIEVPLPQTLDKWRALLFAFGFTDEY